MSIHNFAQKIKGYRVLAWSYIKGREQSLALTTLLVIVAILAFILGYFSRGQGLGNTVVTISCDLATTSSVAIQQNTNLSNNTIVTSQASSIDKKFVASAFGKKYYPVKCSSANRIKDTNKIFFDNEQEAVNAGYTRASNCK